MKRLALLFALIACGPLPVSPPPRPLLSVIQRFDSVSLMLRIDPPVEYVRWLEDVEACSGISSTYDPTFWVVQRRYLKEEPEGTIVVRTHAEHIRSAHKIIFGIGFEMDANHVRHELLHHLLGLINDNIDHDPEYFVKRCGPLVT